MKRAVPILILLLAVLPVPAQFFGGGGGGVQTVSWGLCVNANCAPAATLTVPFIVPAKRKVEWCRIAAATGPVGAALIVDVNKAGTSIFAASRLQIADGQTAGKTAAFASEAARSLEEGDLLTIDIDQVGTTTPGKNVFVTCLLK